VCGPTSWAHEAAPDRGAEPEANLSVLLRIRQRRAGAKGPPAVGVLFFNGLLAHVTSGRDARAICDRRRLALLASAPTGAEIPYRADVASDFSTLIDGAKKVAPETARL
jgi:hypothetical protein